MSQFDTDSSRTDVYSRPLAPWEDQISTSSTISWNDLKDPNIQMKPGGIGLGNLHRTGNNFKPHSEIADSEGGPGKMKRNVHQTHAFKTAIATLGKKQPRVPSRDRTRKEIARGTSWGTTSLSKTPFWNTKDEFKPLSNSQSPQQPPQQQQVDYHQQQQQPIEENVVATFDISFVDDSEFGISITPSITNQTNQNGTGFQSAEMTLENSTDSSTVSTQPQPTATTSRSSFTSTGFGGSEMSTWATIREEERLKAEKVAIAKAKKWNPKAQEFQFNPTPSENDSPDKPTTPIFEFAKPNDEPEKPFFTFTSKDNDPTPLFDFSTALNSSKITYPKQTQESEDYYQQKLQSTMFASESNDFIFSIPTPKKVVISSPHSDSSKSTSKPNPEAPAFTPTLSNVSVDSTPSPKPTWNLNVTEFIPSQNTEQQEKDYIPSFVTRPKSTKVTIKLPQEKEEEVINDLESQTQPETTRGLEEPIPIIQIKLSFAPGVTSTLVVFEEDSPKHIVAEFCRKHDLTMTQKAQNSFVDTLTKLKQAKLNSLSKNK